MASWLEKALLRRDMTSLGPAYSMTPWEAVGLDLYLSANGGLDLLGGANTKGNEIKRMILEVSKERKSYDTAVCVLAHEWYFDEQENYEAEKEDESYDVGDVYCVAEVEDDNEWPEWMWDTDEDDSCYGLGDVYCVAEVEDDDEYPAWMSDRAEDDGDRNDSSQEETSCYEVEGDQDKSSPCEGGMSCATVVVVEESPYEEGSSYDVEEGSYYVEEAEEEDNERVLSEVIELEIDYHSRNSKNEKTIRTDRKRHSRH